MDRDVLFDLDLPTQLTEPVRLYLEYRNVDNGLMDTKITSAMYTNLRNIRHIEFDSEVQFERFEVSVALISTTRVIGPVVPAGQYGKCTCTVCYCYCASVYSHTFQLFTCSYKAIVHL